MKVFSGSANQKLAKDIVDHLNIPLSQISIKRLKDSEIYVKIEENVRGVDTRGKLKQSSKVFPV